MPCVYSSIVNANKTNKIPVVAAESNNGDNQWCGHIYSSPLSVYNYNNGGKLM